MPLDERDYMRDVPEYRRLVGKDRRLTSSSGGGGGGRPPTAFADPPQEPPWWNSLGDSSRARTRPWAWFLLGIIVTLSALAVLAERGAFDATGEPLPPSAATAQPPASSSGRTVAIVDGVPAVGPPLRLPIGGKGTFTRGTSVRVRGTSPMRRPGAVVVKLRWNGGRWQTVQRTRAAAGGAYDVRFVLNKRGRAQLRIVFEGGSFAYKWYRVT